MVRRQSSAERAGFDSLLRSRGLLAAAGRRPPAGSSQEPAREAGSRPPAHIRHILNFRAGAARHSVSHQ